MFNRFNPPVITYQAANQTLAAGSETVLAVFATGTPRLTVSLRTLF
jgi:hypothetical protein